MIPTPHRCAPWRRLPAALLACVAMTAPAVAQEFLDQEAIAPEHAVDPDSMDTVDLLERRERGNMHPGNPFELTGLGQGDNDFRRGLHAAGRGAYEPAMVDREVLRDRQLAMYEGRSRFSSPVRRARAEEPPPEVPSATSPAAPDERDGGRSTTWIGIVLAAGSSVVYFLMRGRLAA